MKFGGSLYLSLSLKSLFHCLEWYRAQSWVPYYLTSTSDPYTSASDQPVLRASPEADITMQLNALNWEWSWMRYCGWRCSGWHDGSMVGLIRSIMFVCLYSRIHAQAHTQTGKHTQTHTYVLSGRGSWIPVIYITYEMYLLSFSCTLPILFPNTELKRPGHVVLNLNCKISEVAERKTCSNKSDMQLDQI